MDRRPIRPVRPFRSGALAALLVAALPAPSVAQAVPSADSLIDGFVESIGGRDVFLSLEGMRQTGTVGVPSVGLEGQFEALQRAPDQMILRVRMPGFGEISTGYDGEVGWSVDPMAGPSLLEGARLEAIREEASILAAVRDAALIPGRETVGLVEFGGEECWRVRLEWASGRESHDCYSPESGLLIASESSQITQMGEVPVTNLFFDYRDFHGMLLPTRIEQSAMGQVQIMRLNAVAVDDVGDDEMAPPRAIETLLDRAGSR